MEIDKTVLDALHEYKKTRLTWTIQLTSDQKITEDVCWSHLKDTIGPTGIVKWMDQNAPGWAQIY